MSVPSVIDLLAPPTRDDIETLVLAYLQLAQNPVTDWNSGAVQLTMLNIETAILASLLGPGTPPATQSALAALLANGYPDTAAGDSLATLSDGWYDIEKSRGAYAVQTVTLICDATHGPYTFSAGLYEALASDGARYVGAGSGTLSASSSLTLDFNARTVGLAKALITQLAPSLPGVSVFSAAIKVVGGVAQFGADADSDSNVKTKVAAAWPDLAAVPDQDRVEKWIFEAGTSTTRVRPDPDPVLPGGVIWTLANATGPVPSGDVTTATNFVLARQGITDNNSFANASVSTVTPGGTVTVPTAQREAVQAAAAAAWVEYLSTSEIGGEVYLLALIQAVMDAGATNFVDPTLNGFGADLVLGSSDVAVPVDTTLATLTWVTT